MFHSMTMNMRVAFPITMFVLAALSFSYGAYQHFSARAARATDSRRLAFILETIESSGTTSIEKQRLYRSIADGLPAFRPVLGIDFSGSFAAEDRDDQCASDGQRAMCHALLDENTDPTTVLSVCGACDPR